MPLREVHETHEKKTICKRREWITCLAMNPLPFYLCVPPSSSSSGEIEAFGALCQNPNCQKVVLYTPIYQISQATGGHDEKCCSSPSNGGYGGTSRRGGRRENRASKSGVNDCNTRQNRGKHHHPQRNCRASEKRRIHPRLVLILQFLHLSPSHETVPRASRFSVPSRFRLATEAASTGHGAAQRRSQISIRGNATGPAISHAANC